MFDSPWPWIALLLLISGVALWIVFSGRPDKKP